MATDRQARHGLESVDAAPLDADVELEVQADGAHWTQWRPIRFDGGIDAADEAQAGGGLLCHDAASLYGLNQSIDAGRQTTPFVP
jgi:hypothetical protein